MTAETLVNRRTWSTAKEGNANASDDEQGRERELIEFRFRLGFLDSKNGLAEGRGIRPPCSRQYRVIPYCPCWSRVSRCLCKLGPVYCHYENYPSLQPARQRYSVHPTTTCAPGSRRYRVPLLRVSGARYSLVTGTEETFSGLESHRQLVGEAYTR